MLFYFSPKGRKCSDKNISNVKRLSQRGGGLRVLYNEGIRIGNPQRGLSEHSEAVGNLQRDLSKHSETVGNPQRGLSEHSDKK